MIEVSIPFKHLTSKNKKFVVWGGRPRLSDNYRDGKKAIYNIAKEQAAHKPYDEPVMVHILFHMPNAVHRDILNYTQQLCDGLEGVCYTDDWLIAYATVERGEVDKENPRVEVTVIPTE